MESEIPNYYKPLSLALYQVLEDSGASIELRNTWEKNYAMREIIEAIHWQPEVSPYYFGSSREGTTHVDMNPDVDIVCVDNTLPVITDCSDVSGVKSLVLVQDNDTHAGYAKLQLVYNGIPLFRNFYGELNAVHFNTIHTINYADKFDRLVITFNPTQGMEKHGPAMFWRAPVGRLTTDNVFAFNLPKLPGCIEDWIARTRYYNWPSGHVMDRCKTLGCLFVPVGHPKSDEQHLQWRFSLSQQERLLVSQFTSVQHKCYFLLKLWKKEILPSWIAQESLSSYHCKTCMFYMIENTPSDFWRPDNLLVCFVACLKMFLFWTTNGICPNYFIPAENMFDRRVHGDLRYNLQQVIQIMLTADCKYLAQIGTSHIGDILLSCVAMRISTPQADLERAWYNIKTKTRLAIITTQHSFYWRQRCIQKWFSNRLQQNLINLYNLSLRLKHTTRITEHTEEETRQALSSIVPHLDLHLMTSMVALAKEQGRRREVIWRLLSSDSWNQLSLRSDISVKLKQASLMYMFGYYHASLAVLSTIEICGVYSDCSCYNNPEPMALPTYDELIVAALNQPSVTMERLAHRLLISCVSFLPTERNVTPDALCYEMSRFVDGPPGHTDELNCDYLQECAVIDGVFLFHFLL